ncbi:MAG TPA: nucleotide disphospho-sugar-binding domain-containing protein [Acidimicrobiales bacterium]|nr:nucleotide disphospho-sugar-binding domain-containing protein [Acidimicrobiales bacterium]
MFRLAYFDPFPPSLDNPARSFPVRCYPYQPDPLGTRGECEVVGLPAPPWVWVTLGTVFNGDPGRWASLGEELKDLDVQVVATVGNGVEVSALASPPPNVTVLSFVPARVMLEGAVAVLCYAGAGTMLGALRYGLPLVCWPQGADQFHNARACEVAGASVTINDAHGALQGLRRVLGSEGYLSRAKRLREEVLAMPSAEQCVPVLEELAGSR